MQSILLDSVILIDHFNGLAEATEYLRRTEGFCVVSAITRAEVLTGFSPEGLRRALPLINHFPALEINTRTADLAAALRRTHKRKLPDAFQAALAQLHKIKLATRNHRDFPPDRFDFVTVPY